MLLGADLGCAVFSQHFLVIVCLEAVAAKKATEEEAAKIADAKKG